MRDWPRRFGEMADQEGGWLWGLEPQCGVVGRPRWVGLRVYDPSHAFDVGVARAPP